MIESPNELEVIQSYYKTPSAFLNCLRPFLNLLHWKGNTKLLLENIPHFSEKMDLPGFIHVMNRLGFNNSYFQTHLNEIDKRHLPCLFVTEDNVLIFTNYNKNSIRAFDGKNNRYVKLKKTNINGIVYLFKNKNEKQEKSFNKNYTWFLFTVVKFKKLLFQILGMSFLINLIGLVNPLFILTIYNKVIVAQSVSMLYGFTIGVVIALLFMLIFQAMRANLLAYVSTRLDLIISNSIMDRLLYLPSIYLENSPIEYHISRIKDFDTLKDFLTSALVISLFDLPFISLSVFFIWILGHSLAFIPIIMIIIFILMGVLSRHYIHDNVIENANSSSERQRFLVNLMPNFRVAKYTNSESIWKNRYKEISANAIIQNYKANLITSIISTISDSLMIIAGLATIGFGTLSILDNNLSVGALLVIMILTWRTLGPLKSFYISMSRLDQLKYSIKQINRFMELPSEKVLDTSKKFEINSWGVKCFFVSMRYRSTLDPALSGINFEVKSGTLTVLTGQSGSGKSTLLKIIAGIYTPQNGTVLIGNKDIRQINPIELRNTIGFVSQDNFFFYGTISENFLLTNPTLLKNDIENILKEMQLFEDLLNLPDWINIHTHNQKDQVLPINLMIRLNLARALLKKPKLLLIDDSIDYLDKKQEDIFIRILKKLHGETTVFLVTKKLSYLNIADQLAVLNKGQLIQFGPLSSHKTLFGSKNVK